MQQQINICRYHGKNLQPEEMFTAIEDIKKHH